MIEDRYYVDDRTGCVAIRDRTVSTDTNGLHDDTPGVVWFRMKKEVIENCPACGNQTTRWPNLDECHLTRGADSEAGRLNEEWESLKRITGG